MDESTKKQAKNIYDMAKKVRWGLGGCRSAYSSSRIYGDDYIKIESGYSFDIRLNDKERTVVFYGREGNNDEFTCSAFRPGQWVEHLEKLSKKVDRNKADEKQEEELIDSLRFIGIDDSLFFDTSPKVKPEAPQQSVAEMLEDLFRDIIREEIDYSRDM